jgi:hypothetical protein
MEGGRRQRQPTTVSRGSGGAPARSSRAEEGRRSNAAWGMGKRSREELLGKFLRPGKARRTRSSCWQARRRAWRLGRRWRDVEGQGKGQQRSGSGGCSAGGARGAEKSGTGQPELRKTAGEGGRVTGARQSRGRGWRLKTRTDLQFSKKCRDSTVKPKQLSNHSSNENVPKSKSVELSKIYNFALRFSFKRIKDLNLI